MSSRFKLIQEGSSGDFVRQVELAWNEGYRPVPGFVYNVSKSSYFKYHLLLVKEEENDI